MFCLLLQVVFQLDTTGRLTVASVRNLDAAGKQCSSQLRAAHQQE